MNKTSIKVPVILSVIVTIVIVVLVYVAIKSPKPQTNVADQASSSEMYGLSAKVKADLANMRVAAEIYYDNSPGGSYAGLCSSDDKGFAPLKNDLAPAEYHFVCMDSKTAWAASAALATGGYWCVDSTGSSAATSSSNSTTACK